MKFHIDSRVPVDKIRVSFGGLVISTASSGFMLWSDLTNSVIGSVGFEPNSADLGGGVLANSSPLKPKQGVELFYANRALLQGDYQLIPQEVFGAAPTGMDADSYILVNIEYWAFDKC